MSRRPGEARRRFGGFLAAVGGATIVAGSFADWVRADITSRGLLEGTGWRNVYGHVAHGPWLAALGAVVIVIGATYLVGLRSAWARWAGIVAGLGAIAFAIYEIHDITTPVAGVTTTLQPGLWIVIVGAALGGIGLLLTVGATPAARPSSGSAPSPGVAPRPTTFPAAPPPSGAVVAPSGAVPGVVAPTAVPPVGAPAPPGSGVPPPDPTLLG